MIVRVTYNSYNRGAQASAQDMVKRLKKAFPDKNLILSTMGVPYAGNDEFIKAEVAVDLYMSNLDPARELAAQISASLGIPASTYHNND